MTKLTITEAERLQLIGLFVLHDRAMNEQRRIEVAIGEIVGIEDEGYGYYGLASDELQNQTPDVDNLLKQLEITVETE